MRLSSFYMGEWGFVEGGYLLFYFFRGGGELRHRKWADQLFNVPSPPPLLYPPGEGGGKQTINLNSPQPIPPPPQVKKQQPLTFPPFI